MFTIIITSLCSGIIGAIIGAIISVKLTTNSQIKLMKKKVAEDLFGYRYQLLNGKKISDDILYCLNKIPIVFHDNKNAVQAWKDLFNDINKKTEEQNAVKTDSLTRLIIEVCRDIAIEIKEDEQDLIYNVMI